MIDDERGLLRLDRALLTRMAQTAVSAEIAKAAKAAKAADEVANLAGATGAASAAGIPGVGTAEISLSVVIPEEMRELNKIHRGVDASTDVLSFPQFENAEEVIAAAASGRTFSLGDIVINTVAAEAQAKDYGHSVEREQAYLFVHGLLHLLGHDHEAAADRTAMREAEEAVLEETGLGRGDSLFSSSSRESEEHE
jgi:rRNA maturation RNase YbeY